MNRRSVPVAPRAAARFLALLLVFAFAACTPKLDPIPPPTITESPPAVAHPGRLTSCPPDGAGVVTNTGIAPGTKPTGFAPKRVIRCLSDAGTSGSDGKLHFVIQQLSGDYTPQLAAALSAPNPAPPSGGRCTLDWTPVVYVLVLDDHGRSYRAYIPHDHCGVATEQVMQALAALTIDRTYEVAVACDRRC